MQSYLQFTYWGGGGVGVYRGIKIIKPPPPPPKGGGKGGPKIFTRKRFQTTPPPPPPQSRSGTGDHNFYKERMGRGYSD